MTDPEQLTLDDLLYIYENEEAYEDDSSEEASDD